MQQSKLTSILIFCDGACSGNPGPGGWGAIVANPQGTVKELGGRAETTTNNQMELTAAISALEFISKSSGPVILCTDSVYVIRGITQWINNWRKRGWVTAEGNAVANRELWERLSEVVAIRGAGHPITWQHVRGHAGNAANERADEIAVAFSKGTSVILFEGKLETYPVALDFSPAAARSQSVPTYLSLVDGAIGRHRTWGECEKAIKGKSGAKFKKVHSLEQEKELLRAWGVVK